MRSTCCRPDLAISTASPESSEIRGRVSPGSGWRWPEPSHFIDHRRHFAGCDSHTVGTGPTLFGRQSDLVDHRPELPDYRLGPVRQRPDLLVHPPGNAVERERRTACTTNAMHANATAAATTMRNVSSVTREDPSLSFLVYVAAPSLLTRRDKPAYRPPRRRRWFSF